MPPKLSCGLACLAFHTFAVVAWGAGIVAVIDDQGPGDGTGTLWCDFLTANGYTCTLFPHTGPTSPLDPFDTLIDLSSFWSDPSGELPSFLQSGRTVILHASAPMALGINSNPSVQAWIGANSIFGDGFDGLRTVASDPVLGSIQVGTLLERMSQP